MDDINLFMLFSKSSEGEEELQLHYENVPGEIWDMVLHWTSLDGLAFILGFLTNHVNSFKKKSIQELLWRSQIKISAPHASCEQKKNILDNE